MLEPSVGVRDSRQHPAHSVVDDPAIVVGPGSASFPSKGSVDPHHHQYQHHLQSMLHLRGHQLPSHAGGAAAPLAPAAAPLPISLPPHLGAQLPLQNPHTHPHAHAHLQHHAHQQPVQPTRASLAVHQQQHQHLHLPPASSLLYRAVSPAPMPASSATNEEDESSASRIDLQRLAQWADDASRQEITEQLLHQAVEIQRLDDIAASLSEENAKLAARVKQLEMQLRGPIVTITRSNEDGREEDTETDGALHVRTQSPVVINNLASFRKAREFCNGRLDSHSSAELQSLDAPLRRNHDDELLTEAEPGLAATGLRAPEDFFEHSVSPLVFARGAGARAARASAGKTEFVPREYTQLHHSAASIIQARYRRFKLEQRWKAVKTGARRRSLQLDGAPIRVSTGSNLSGAIYDSGILGLRIAEEVGLEPDVSVMETTSFPRSVSAPVSHAASPSTPRSTRIFSTSAVPSPESARRTVVAAAPSPGSLLVPSARTPLLSPLSQMYNRPGPQATGAAAAAAAPAVDEEADDGGDDEQEQQQQEQLQFKQADRQFNSISPLAMHAASRPESILSPATRIEQNAMAISAALQYEDSELDDSILDQSRSSSPDTSRYQHSDTGGSTPPSLEAARMRRMGIYHFNRDPRKGVDWLMGHGILRDEARNVANFFHTEPGLNRRMIGEYLGNVTNSFNLSVLDAYVDQFDLAHMTFDHALRFFIASFRLPGEAQKIERILLTFAKKYHLCNPGLFGNEDTPFVLAFSIVMLNTDAHNAANKRKMCKEDWVRNNRGIDNGKDLPRKYLEEIYDRISAEEFQTLPDNSSIVERVALDIVGCKEPLVAPYRQFLRMCIAYEVEEAEKASGKSRHTRALYLFNDRLIVTKPKGNNKYAFRQSIPLLDMTLTVERSSTRTYPVLTLLNRANVCVYRFSIDPTGRGAGRFEEDLREMIATCLELEFDRLKKSKDSDSASRRSINSTTESGTSGTGTDDHRKDGDSPMRKSQHNVSKYFSRRQKGGEAGKE